MALEVIAAALMVRESGRWEEGDCTQRAILAGLAPSRPCIGSNRLFFSFDCGGHCITQFQRMVATTLARSPLACRRAITARPARGSVRVQAATLALPDSVSKVRKLLSNAGRH